MGRNVRVSFRVDVALQLDISTAVSQEKAISCSELHKIQDSGYHPNLDDLGSRERVAYRREKLLPITARQSAASISQGITTHGMARIPDIVPVSYLLQSGPLLTLGQRNIPK